MELIFSPLCIFFHIHPTRSPSLALAFYLSTYLSNLTRFPIFLLFNIFVTCFHEFRIYKSTNIFQEKSCFLLKQGRIYLLTFCFCTKRHFTAPLFHTNQDFFVKKKMLIRRFGIHENMPRAKIIWLLFRSKWDSLGSITTPLKNPSRR